MKMFSRQFSIKRTNSRGHTTIIEAPNLFCQKSSSHVPKKNASFNKEGSLGVVDDVFSLMSREGAIKSSL